MDDSMLSALRREAADVLVGALRDPASLDDVLQEHLFDDPLAIVVRASHPLAATQGMNISALRGYPWIAPRAGSPLRRHFDELLQTVGARADVAPIESNSLDALRRQSKGVPFGSPKPGRSRRRGPPPSTAFAL